MVRFRDQWLGTEINQNLGLTDKQWESFTEQLSVEPQNFLKLKQSDHSNESIIQILNLTEKEFQLRWSELLSMAAQV